MARIRPRQEWRTQNFMLVPIPLCLDIAGSLATFPTTLDDLVPTVSSSTGVVLRPFFSSLSMIVISELGDKTFLIAALMAMKHDRSIVFAAAFLALLFMSIFSGLLGHAMPSLLPKWLTQFVACSLFLMFGAKMCWEGHQMDKDASVDAELAEVESELETGLKRIHTLSDASCSNDEVSMTGNGEATLMVMRTANGMHNLLALVFSPVFIQTFTLTFLGEWGDRSQIATIAMAAGSDYWWVIVGTVLGHGLCTIIAVLGGRLLAKKISIRQVTLGGGILFILFGILYLLELVRG